MSDTEVLDRVIDYIARHELRDGDLLPAERKLAEDLSISRRELRGALASLEAAGRIWRGVGRGTYLGARPLKFSQKLSGLSVGTSPSDVAEMRVMIEPALVALATMKASPADLAELQKIARKNAATRDDYEWQQWDHRFHLLLAQATRNPAIIALLEAINGVRVQPALREKTVDHETRKHFAEQHQAIVAAMTARDSELAEQRMREHLLSVQLRVTAREKGAQRAESV
ncbi:FadR/GntR family transcriptional regulator [Paraburkholderia rhizosphaerae]|uniref:GntR family transcriptional regulator n=1 Tax=Paraburkholderia rhizosphaerae TaxID=480658 RepID=A0A4R8LYS8_9BURK|nr:FCD domain-containing protein [Paraburkholderia rhizosphaerae]TDY51965.1 GntR family transcriptional regulator [Paraburkholderia rhizosphaerae]